MHNKTLSAILTAGFAAALLAGPANAQLGLNAIGSGAGSATSSLGSATGALNGSGSATGQMPLGTPSVPSVPSVGGIDGSFSSESSLSGVLPRAGELAGGSALSGAIRGSTSGIGGSLGGVLDYQGVGVPGEVSGSSSYEGSLGATTPEIPSPEVPGLDASGALEGTGELGLMTPDPAVANAVASVTGSIQGSGPMSVPEVQLPGLPAVDVSGNAQSESALDVALPNVAAPQAEAPDAGAVDGNASGSGNADLLGSVSAVTESIGEVSLGSGDLVSNVSAFTDAGAGVAIPSLPSFSADLPELSLPASIQVSANGNTQVAWNGREDEPANDEPQNEESEENSDSDQAESDEPSDEDQAQEEAGNDEDTSDQPEQTEQAESELSHEPQTRADARYGASFRF